MPGLLSGLGGGGAAGDGLQDYLLNVVTAGAVGDDTTDDRATIQAAINSAKALGVGLLFPSGKRFWCNGYLDFNGCRGMRIVGVGGASIRYPSDDVTIVADSIALSNAHARSCIYLRNCLNVLIEDLEIVGGDKSNITSVNIGNAISARNTSGTTVKGVTARGGYALFAQDSVGPSTGTGDSLTVSSGTVTLVDSAAIFHPGMVRRWIYISGATNKVNDGWYEVTEYVSATTIRFRNTDAITETSSFTWTVDDGDRGTRLIECNSIGTRGAVSVASFSSITNCWFRRPLLTDTCGRVDQFEVSGTTVTITDRVGRFRANMHNKIVTIGGATSGGNNVQKVCTYISNTQISFTNASGVAEYGNPDTPTTWWIANGDRVGFGAGAGSITVAAGVVTLVSSTAAFTADDVHKTVRVIYASNAANQGAFAISEFVNSTTIKFSNSSAVNESFVGIWSVDSYDRSNLPGSDTCGSTHGVYIFAGSVTNPRTNVIVEGCYFEGIRTTGVKASGSSTPVRDVLVTGCTFVECGEAFNAGGDDFQEHTNLTFHNNTVIDCGTNTLGRSSSVAVAILGARGVNILSNRFYYSRNTIGALDGRGIAGNFGIQVAGGAQPLEDVTVFGNKFTIDETNTNPGKVLTTAINVQRAGLRNKWATSGTLTKVGNVMTLTDASYFSTQDVDKYVQLVNSASGNDGLFRIVSATGSTVSFVNAGGTGGGVSAGTWRIMNFGFDGACTITHNDIHGAAGVGIYTQSCMGPFICWNSVSRAGIYLQGDCFPIVRFNREYSTGTQTSKIRIFSGTSWPTIGDNEIVNQSTGITSGWDFSIGDSSGNDYDFPFLGLSGRALPSEGRPEVVFSWGANHVDGDYITVAGNTFTYKASAPGTNQFNSMAGLIALIDALADYTCADYGAGFSPSIITEHIRIRRATASTTADLFRVSANSLHGTALVLNRNSPSPHTACDSRGQESSAGAADRTVLWTPMAKWTAQPRIIAENSTARKLLHEGSYATGLITCVAKASLADTDYITVDDGFFVRVYEFDTAGDGVTVPGRIQVNVSTDTTAAQVAARLRTAVLNTSPGLAIVDNADGTLSLTSKWPGTAYNVAITENVANAGFTVSGMSGGSQPGFYIEKNGGMDGGCNETVVHGKASGSPVFRWAL